LALGQTDGTIEVWALDAPDRVRHVSWVQAHLDSDGDGLTDLVERRLGTDPRSQDSDGDGVPDPADSAPTASVRTPESEEQAIALAVVEQYSLFHSVREGRWALAVVVGDAALEWRAGGGPVITLSQAEDERFITEVGRDGVNHLTIDQDGRGYLVEERSSSDEEESPGALPAVYTNLGPTSVCTRWSATAAGSTRPDTRSSSAASATAGSSAVSTCCGSRESGEMLIGRRAGRFSRW
jgi:hypothetical protein